ncbi:MAG: YdeI/OmpD-associated family protein [Chitinophagaceae bacterium]
MVRFTAAIKKFGQQGEKTGWTYVEISAAIAQQLIPGNKKIFRVKGALDNYPIERVALVPMGGGDFIMPINAAMRKGIKKIHGATVQVQLEVDNTPIKPPKEFIECLKDEPTAFEYYNSLPKSHQNYFTKWIESAKTEPTQARRIAHAVTALATGANYGEMLRKLQRDKAM